MLTRQLDQSTELGSGSSSQRFVVLRARGLRLRYGQQVLLDGVDLQLRRGEIVLMTGPNGAGKTTTANILTGYQAPDAGVIDVFTNGTKQTFSFPRRWRDRLKPWDRFTPERIAREGIGRTWQDIRLFATHTLEDNIAVAAGRQPGESPADVLLRPCHVARCERENRQSSRLFLDRLGLGDRSQSSADMVSLGQSKRVAIARAVQAGAKVLFLDEPLSGLDGRGVHEVLEMLRELVQSHQLTLLIIEHILNVPHVLSLSTVVWHLQDGRMTIETPEQAHSRVLPKLAHSDEWPHAASILKGKPARHSLMGGAALEVFARNTSDSNPAVLELEDVVIHRGSRLVIGEVGLSGAPKGLSFSIRKGELAFLRAPNGWGKSTLLAAAAGLIPITRGCIRLNGQPVTGLNPWERVALGLSLVQAHEQSFPGLSVKDVLALCKRGHLGDLHRLTAKRMSDLSGGERQRVALACRPMVAPDGVQLLDEPFAALDEPSIWDLRQHLLSSGTGAVLIAEPASCHERIG